MERVNTAPKGQANHSRNELRPDPRKDGIGGLGARVAGSPGLIAALGLIDPGSFMTDLNAYGAFRRRRSGKYFIAWGIPGVGKSHTLRGVREMHPETAKNIVMVNVGDEMWSLIESKRPEIRTRDEMRSKLSPQEQADYRRIALERIAQKINSQTEKIFFLDTHALIDTLDKQVGGEYQGSFYDLNQPRFIPGITPDVFDTLGKPKGAIILEEAAWKIVKNRLKDAGKRVRHTHEPLIDEQQLLNRAFAAAVAYSVGFPLLVLQDSNLKEPQAIDSVAEFIIGKK